MKHPLPPLDSLKVFDCAARQLSFSRAADELCLSKGAVSYQIRKLEERLECSLFKRGVRQVLLTDSGQLLFQTTQKIFHDLEDTLKQLEGGRALRVVISTTTYVAARWLSSRIAGFTAQYPDIAITLHHPVNDVSFSIDTVDIAIRWSRCDGRRDPSRLMEMPMPLFPVGNPEIARQIAQSETREGFDSLPLLCEERRLDLWQEWEDGQNLLPNCPRRIIADANVRVQAAIDGQGLVLADELMRPEIDSGVLVPVSDRRLRGYGYVIMSTPSRLKNSNTSLLANWLVKTS